MAVMNMYQRQRPPKIPGPVRPRHEPPTLDEAIAAARDLAEDVAQQTEIAAGLMGVPEEDVAAAVLAADQEAQKAARSTIRGPFVTRSIASRAGAPRVVVVEQRRRSRV